MVTKRIYPAIFHPETDGGYSVDFPDLPGCATKGDTISETVAMAEDALSTYLESLREDKVPYPKSSDPGDIKTEGHDFVSLIKYDEVAQKESLQNSIQNIENDVGLSQQYVDVQALYKDLKI